MLTVAAYLRLSLDQLAAHGAFFTLACGNLLTLKRRLVRRGKQRQQDADRAEDDANEEGADRAAAFVGIDRGGDKATEEPE